MGGWGAVAALLDLGASHSARSGAWGWGRARLSQAIEKWKGNRSPFFLLPAREMRPLSLVQRFCVCFQVLL